MESDVARENASVIYNNLSASNYYIGKNLLDTIASCRTRVKNNDFKSCLNELAQFIARPSAIVANYKAIIKTILTSLKNASPENYPVIIDLLVSFIGDLRLRILPILSHLINFLKILIIDSKDFDHDYKEHLYRIFAFLDEWPLENFPIFHQFFEEWLISPSPVLRVHSSYAIGCTMKRFSDELFTNSLILFVKHSLNLKTAENYYNYLESTAMAIAYALYNSSTNLFWRADLLVKLGLSLYEDDHLHNRLLNTSNEKNLHFRGFDVRGFDEKATNEKFFTREAAINEKDSNVEKATNERPINEEKAINSLFSIYLNAFYHLKCMNGPIDLLIEILISELQRHITTITSNLDLKDAGFVCKEIDISTLYAFSREKLSLNASNEKSATNEKAINEKIAFNTNKLSIAFGFVMSSNIYKPTTMASFYANSLLGLLYWGKPIAPERMKLLESILGGLYDIKTLNNEHLLVLFNNILLPNFEFLSDILANLSVKNPERYTEIIRMIRRLIEKLLANITRAFRLFDTFQIQYMLIQYINRTAIALGRLSGFTDVGECIGLIHQLLKTLNSHKTIEIYYDLNSSLLYILNLFISPNIHNANLLFDDILCYLDDFMQTLSKTQSINNVILSNISQILQLIIALDLDLTPYAGRISRSLVALFNIISPHISEDYSDIDAIIGTTFALISRIPRFDFSQLVESIELHSIYNLPLGLKDVLAGCKTVDSKVLVFAMYVILSSNGCKSGIYGYVSANKHLILQISDKAANNFILQFYAILTVRLIIPNEDQIPILQCFDSAVISHFSLDSGINAEVVDSLFAQLKALVALDYSIANQREKTNLMANIVDNLPVVPVITNIVINVFTSQLFYKFESLWDFSIDLISKLLKSAKIKPNAAHSNIFDREKLLHYYYNLYYSYIKAYVQYSLENQPIYLDTEFTNERKTTSRAIYIANTVKPSKIDELNLFDMLKLLKDGEFNSSKFSKRFTDRSKRKPYVYLFESKIEAHSAISRKPHNSLEFTDPDIVQSKFASLLPCILNKLRSTNDELFLTYLNDVVQLPIRFFQNNAFESKSLESKDLTSKDLTSKVLSSKAFDLAADLIQVITQIKSSSLVAGAGTIQLDRSLLDLSVLLVDNFSNLRLNVRERCMGFLLNFVGNTLTLPDASLINSLINGKDVKSSIDSMLKVINNGEMVVFTKIFYKILCQLSMRLDKSFRSERSVVLDFLNSTSDSMLPVVYYELFSPIITNNASRNIHTWDEFITSTSAVYGNFFQLVNNSSAKANNTSSWNSTLITPCNGGFNITKYAFWHNSIMFTINVNFISSDDFPKFVKWLDKTLSHLSILLKPIYPFIFQIIYDAFLTYSSFNSNNISFANSIGCYDVNNSLSRNMDLILNAVARLNPISDDKLSKSNLDIHSHNIPINSTLNASNSLNAFSRENLSLEGNNTLNSNETTNLEKFFDEKMTINVVINEKFFHERNLTREKAINEKKDKEIKDDIYHSKREINVTKSTLLEILIRLLESEDFGIGTFTAMKASLSVLVSTELVQYIINCNKISSQIVKLVSSLCLRVKSAEFTLLMLDLLPKALRDSANPTQTSPVLSESIELTIKLYTSAYANGIVTDFTYLDAFIDSIRYYWKLHVYLTEIQIEFIVKAVEISGKHANFMLLILITSKNISKYIHKVQEAKNLNNILINVVKSLKLIANSLSLQSQSIADIIIESGNLTSTLLSNSKDIKTRRFACQIMLLTSSCELKQAGLKVPFIDIFKSGYNQHEFDLICDVCTNDIHFRYAMAYFLDTMYAVRLGSLSSNINIDANISFLSDFTRRFLLESSNSNVKTTIIKTQIISTFIRPILDNLFFLITCDCDWLSDHVILLKSIGLFYVVLLEKASALYCLGNNPQKQEGITLFKLASPIANVVEILINRRQQYTLTVAIDIVKRLAIVLKKYKIILAYNEGKAINELEAINDSFSREKAFNEIAGLVFGDVADSMPDVIDMSKSDCKIHFDGKSIHYGLKPHNHFIYDFDDIKKKQHVLGLRKMCDAFTRDAFTRDDFSREKASLHLFNKTTLIKFAIPLTLNYLGQPNSTSKSYSNSLADTAGDFITLIISRYLRLKNLIPSLLEMYANTKQKRIFRIIVAGVGGYKFAMGDGNDSFLSKLLENLIPTLVEFKTNDHKNTLDKSDSSKKSQDNRVCVPGVCELYAMLCNILENIYNNDIKDRVLYIVRRLGNMLKSRDREIRRSARTGLIKLFHINTCYLSVVLHELDLMLQNGYAIPVLSFTSLKIMESFLSNSNNLYKFDDDSIKVIFRIINKELLYILEIDVLEKGIGDVKTVSSKVDEAKRQHFPKICYLVAKYGGHLVGEVLYHALYDTMTQFAKYGKFLPKLKDLLLFTTKGYLEFYESIGKVTISTTCLVNSSMPKTLLWISMDYIYSYSGSCLVEGIEDYISSRPLMSDTFARIVYSRDLSVDVKIIREFYILLGSSALDIIRNIIKYNDCTFTDNIIFVPIVYAFACGNGTLQDKASKCILELIKVNAAGFFPYNWLIVRVIFQYFSRIQCTRDVRNSHITLLKIFVAIIDESDNWLRAVDMSDYEEARTRIYNTLIDVCQHNMTSSGMRIPMLQILHYLFMKNSLKCLKVSKITDCSLNVVKLLLNTQSYATQVFKHGSRIILYVVRHHSSPEITDSLVPLLVKNANTNAHVVLTLFNHIVKSPAITSQLQYIKLIFFICFSFLGHNAVIKSLASDTINVIFKIIPNSSHELIDACYKLENCKFAFSKTLILLSTAIKDIPTIFNGNLLQHAALLLNNDSSSLYADSSSLGAATNEEATNEKFFTREAAINEKATNEEKRSSEDHKLVLSSLRVFLNVLTLLKVDHGYLFTRSGVPGVVSTARGKKNAIASLKRLWEYVTAIGYKHPNPLVVSASLACYHKILVLSPNTVGFTTVVVIFAKCLDIMGFSKIYELYDCIQNIALDVIKESLDFLLANASSNCGINDSNKKFLQEKAATNEKIFHERNLTSGAATNEKASNVEKAFNVAPSEREEAFNELEAFNEKNKKSKDGRTNFFEDLACKTPGQVLKSSISWLCFLIRRHLSNINARYNRLKGICEILQHIASSDFIYELEGATSLYKIITSSRIANSIVNYDQLNKYVKNEDSTYQKMREISSMGDEILKKIERRMDKLGLAQEYIKLLNRSGQYIAKRKTRIRVIRTRNLVCNPKLAAIRKIAKHSKRAINMSI